MFLKYKEFVMAGEEYKIGAANTENIGNMLEILKWKKSLPQDINIECDVCPKTADGKKKAHGIDLFMTIKCPYNNHPRGILIDGKRYAQQSLKNDTLGKWLRHLKSEVEHLDSSLPSLIDAYNLPDDIVIDTGIIALHCHENYIPDVIDKYIREVQFAGRSNKKMSFMVMSNKTLDKIATISNLSSTFSLIEFAYYNDNSFLWNEAITPELIMSTIIPFRYKPFMNGDNNHYKVGILFFDKTPANVKCLIPFFNYIQFLSHSQIDIYVYTAYSQIDKYNTLMESALNDFSLTMKVKFHQLLNVNYALSP
jgi:hypothetical protein